MLIFFGIFFVYLFLGNMEVFILTFNKDRIPLIVDESDVIYDLLIKVSDIITIDVEKSMFIYNGKKLNNLDRVGKYGIKNNDSIFLVTK
jgi:hypothetical protein